jgi:hypothetical protein
MQVDVPLQPTATTNSTPLQSKSGTITESLETRKLAYVHLANGAQPRSQSSVSSFQVLFCIGYMAQCDRSSF